MPEWTVPHAPPSVDPSEWLGRALAAGPQRPFLETADGGLLSYAALEQRSADYAVALASLGAGPGERVALQVEKSPEAVLVYIACLRLGAVLVPLNTAYTAAEVGYFLADAAPCLAIVSPAARERLQPVAQAAGVARLATLGSANDGTLAELAGAARGHALPASARGPGDLAALVYTSGTTGRSKGAMLTRENLATNASVLAAEWRFTEEDVLLHALPLFHVHGLFVAINTVLAAGAALRLLPRFDAGQVIEEMARATVLMGVPTFYTRLLAHTGLTRAASRHMRLFVSGSAPLLADTHREFEARTGHAILERYGMTETLMNTSNPYAGPRRPGSVGPPLPGVALRLTDPASGAALADHAAIGMIEVRGPNVCSGYWRDPGKTAAAFRADGYFVTGDLGRIDAQGYLHIVGREKDVVISGGYNVYPREVEEEVDALEGVLESAVIGLPHPDLGEAVTAVIVPAPGATLTPAGVVASLAARLAGYKVPRRVIVVADLPRNAMGKVQKNTLRETYRQLYAAPGTPPA
jgi:malonyl-CoA/methylmalonyl-CoA synthetase